MCRTIPNRFSSTKSIAVNIPAKTTTEHRPYNVVAILKGSDPVLEPRIPRHRIPSRRRGRDARRQRRRHLQRGRRQRVGQRRHAGDRRGARGRAAAEALDHLSLGQRRGARALGHPLLRLSAAGPARADRRRVQCRHDWRQPCAGLAGRGCRRHDRPERGLPDRSGRPQRQRRRAAGVGEPRAT